MTIPVWSLGEFFPTYLVLLKAGDADSLGLLYANQAVLTSSGGPGGNDWAVGRDQIVASLVAALQSYSVQDETPPTNGYELRGDNLAARYGTFHSTIVPKAGGQSMDLTVDAFEVLSLNPAEGWQYVADQSRVVSITKPQPSRT